MNQVSLFAGVGAFELAAQENDIKTVLSCEMDKYACMVLRKHFPYTEVFEDDVRKLTGEYFSRYGRVDVLTAGFPCQTFSIAGKREGFKDCTRGTLFFEVARLAESLRPRYVIMENVKGLFSHDKGRTFGIILNAMDELGYTTEWQLLNSKDFGVPQNRERVFIVGHLRTGSVRPVFPVRSTGGEPNKWATTLQHPGHSGGNYGGMNMVKSGSIVGFEGETHFREIKSGLSPSLCARARNDGSGQPVIKAVLTPDRPEKRQNGRRFKENGEPMFTLTGQDKHGVMIADYRTDEGLRIRDDNISPCLHKNGCNDKFDEKRRQSTSPLLINNTRIRRLTPKECCRLQSFPDDWNETGIDKEGQEVPISDTQRYKQMGNSITVNVLREIYERIRTL